VDKKAVKGVIAQLYRYDFQASFELLKTLASRSQPTQARSEARRIEA